MPIKYQPRTAEQYRFNSCRHYENCDASDIQSITKNYREPREYVVKTGFVQKYALYVSIVAGQVLVHSVATWIP
jgi:hypothetical protein